MTTLATAHETVMRARSREHKSEVSRANVAAHLSDLFGDDVPDFSALCRMLTPPVHDDTLGAAMFYAPERHVSRFVATIQSRGEVVGGMDIELRTTPNLTPAIVVRALAFTGKNRRIRAAGWWAHLCTLAASVNAWAIVLYPEAGAVGAAGHLGLDVFDPAKRANWNQEFRRWLAETGRADAVNAFPDSDRPLWQLAMTQIDGVGVWGDFAKSGRAPQLDVLALRRGDGSAGESINGAYLNLAYRRLVKDGKLSAYRDHDPTTLEPSASVEWDGDESAPGLDVRPPRKDEPLWLGLDRVTMNGGQARWAPVPIA